MKAAALLATIALAGCATQPPMMFVHIDGNRDEGRFRRDTAECEYEAVRSTASYTPDTRGMRTAFGAALSSAIDMRDRRMDVALACMSARGYIRKPADSTSLRVNADPSQPSVPFLPPTPPAPPPPIATVRPPSPPTPQDIPPPPQVTVAPQAPVAAPPPGGTFGEAGSSGSWATPAAPEPVSTRKPAPQIVCEAGVCTFK